MPGVDFDAPITFDAPIDFDGVVFNLGACCCSGESGSGSGSGSGGDLFCGAMRFSEVLTITWDDVDADCVDPCSAFVFNAPIVPGEAYALARCCSHDDVPECNITGAPINCGGCYNYGDLLTCEVLALYGLDVDCVPCPDPEPGLCPTRYKFVDSFDCGELGTRDYYLSIYLCIDVSNVETLELNVLLCVQWIVVDPNFPAAFFGGGFNCAPIPLIVTLPNDCTTSAVSNTCDPVGHIWTGFVPCFNSIAEESGPFPVTYVGPDAFPDACCGTPAVRVTINNG